MFNIRTDDATINHLSSRVVSWTRLHKICIDIIIWFLPQSQSVYKCLLHNKFTIPTFNFNTMYKYILFFNLRYLIIMSMCIVYAYYI